MSDLGGPPGLGSYLEGSVSVVVIVAALGWGAYHLRRWFLPSYTGPLARLAELVLAATLGVLTLQALGTLGQLRAGWIPAACAAVGIAAGLIGRARARGQSAKRPLAAPPVSRIGLAVAAGVVSWTVAEWSLPTLLALDQGMFGGDSVWYHMPTSARFAQEGGTWALHFTDPLHLAVWYYPHTFELLNGAGIAVFGSDFVAPVMNLGWLGVGFLAAWCIGRPFGLGPATVVCAGLVFNSRLMWETQAGEARNDIMALALLLAIAAFLVNGSRVTQPRAAPATSRRLEIEVGTLIAAGLAAGLAVSTKLTMLLPVGVIALGVVFCVKPQARRRSVAILAGAMCVAGSYWYVRNLVHAGNPLPLLESIGPIELPHPEQMPLYPRPPHSVAGYLLDPAIYRYWFLPQLNLALGPLWPLLLLAGLGASAHSLRRSPSLILRVLAAAALVTAFVYLLTPIGASGPIGQPKGFFSNTRYLMAALLLGLTLLPLAAPMRFSGRRRAQVLAGLTTAFVASALLTLPPLPGYLGGAVVLTAAMVWVPMALAWLRTHRSWHGGPVVAGALAVVALVLVLGRAQEEQYAAKRYTDPEPFFRQAGPVDAFTWARDVRESRIGVVGSGELFFTQYGWYGNDLSNHVQYVGVPGPNGAFRLPHTCGELRDSVNAGDFDYIVTTRYGTDTLAQERFPVWGWLRDDKALRELMAEEVRPQPAWVYQVEGELDPGTCGEKPRRPSGLGSPSSVTSKPDADMRRVQPAT